MLTAALCRIFAQDGLRVAPFKAQNMSNNAAVTAEGLEIGRAQAEQAAAAGVEPEVAMNPVLLKPQGDRTSQLVLEGRPSGLLHSGDFGGGTRRLWPHAARALDGLRARFDLVVAEGAGSAAEPNLREGDIANMRVARHAGGPALLVGDIDRGGVFAHLLGTVELLPPEDRALVRGFVLNRFRGDPALLAPAVGELEARTGVPVLGVTPWIEGLEVAEEDAVALERPAAPPPAGDAPAVDVAVVRLPRIANFDDFDPLAAEPGVRLRWVEDAAALGRPDLAVLPGTKATAADLGWLRSRGLDRALAAHAEAGGAVLGVCGGFQMLGERLVDEHGAEAPAGTRLRGLGLLPVETRFAAAKTTRRADGRVAPEAAAAGGPWAHAAGLPVEGYEIHMGSSAPAEGAEARPLLRLGGRPDGAVSADGRVAGAYLHGLFHNDALRAALLRALGRPEASAGAAAPPFAERRERAFDRLADAVRASLDVPRVRALLGLA